MQQKVDFDTISDSSMPVDEIVEAEESLSDDSMARYSEVTSFGVHKPVVESVDETPVYFEPPEEIPKIIKQAETEVRRSKDLSTVVERSENVSSFVKPRIRNSWFELFKLTNHNIMCITNEF